VDEVRLTARTGEGGADERRWAMTADFLDSLPRTLQDAAYRAAIVHWFDPDVLRAVLDEPDATDADEFYRRLQTFPFIEDYVGRGHNVHSLVRGAVLDHLWRSRRDFYRDVSARAAAHFGRPFEETGEGDFTDLIEAAYHLVVADEPEGIGLAGDLVDGALASVAFDLANGLVETLQEQLDAGRVSPVLGWHLLAWRARVAAGTGSHEDAIRFAAEVEAIDEVPAALRGGMALLAATSLMEVGQFEEAERWVRRAREHEEPGTLEAARNLAALARLFHLRGDLGAAELAYMDALDAYVPRLLPPLRAVELEPEAESREAVTAWTVVDEVEGEEEVVLPPRPVARFPEAWTIGYDEDSHYYLLTIGDDVADAAPASGPPAWPVMVDGFLALLWIRLGYLYFDLDRNDQADACARLGGSIASDVGSETLIADASQLLYRLGARTGDADAARAVISHQTALLESARAREDVVDQLHALLHLAEVYTDAGELAAAQTASSEAIELSAEVPDPVSRAAAIEKLGVIDWIEGSYAAAGARFDEALEVVRSGGFATNEASLLLQIGAFYLSRHRPEDARRYYEAALSRHRKLEMAAGEWEAVLGLGNVARDRVQYVQAAEYFRQAIELADTPSIKARSLAALADVQSTRGESEAARESAVQAVELAQSVGNRALEAELLATLGDVALTSKAFDEALESYHRSGDLHAEMKRPLGEVNAWIGIVATERARRRTDRAVEAAESLLARAAKAGDRDCEVKARSEAALAYSDARDYERALELVEEAIELDPEDPELLGTLSWILVSDGRYEPGLEASKAALTRDPTLSWAIANGALALLALGRTDEALAAYARAVEARSEGEDFEDDVEALKELLREHPDLRGGEEALRLLQEDAA
jgi:tetratricopeptide (TPR) repeat protein